MYANVLYGDYHVGSCFQLLTIHKINNMHTYGMNTLLMLFYNFAFIVIINFLFMRIRIAGKSSFI